MQNWKFRHFEFDGTTLHVSYSVPNVEMQGVKTQFATKGQGIIVKCVDVTPSPAPAFDLSKITGFTATWGYCFNIHIENSGGAVVVLEVAAESAEDKDRWMHALTSAIGNSLSRWQAFIGELSDDQVPGHITPKMLLTSVSENSGLCSDLATHFKFELHDIAKGKHGMAEPPEYRPGTLHEVIGIQVHHRAGSSQPDDPWSALERALRAALRRPIVGLYNLQVIEWEEIVPTGR